MSNTIQIKSVSTPAHLDTLAERVRLIVESFPHKHCNRQWLEQKLLDDKVSTIDVLACIPLACDKGYVEIQGDELILQL